MPRRALRRHRRKPARKTKGRRKPTSGIPRSMGLGNQMAKIVETIEFNNVVPNTVQGCVFNISYFERARTLATNFRWYKPTLVTWTIEPQYNTYQSGVTNPTVPYLYSIMNRTQDASFMTLSDLLTQGARPKKLIGVNKVTYRPNWCSPGLMVQNVVAAPGFGGMLNNVFIQGLKPEYGWLQAPNLLTLPSYPTTIRPYLATNGSVSNTEVQNQAGTTFFNGHQFYIEQTVPSGASTPTYKISCQVHWAFKDPKNVLAGATDNIFADLSGNQVSA